MQTFKGTGIDYLRKAIDANGDDSEQQLVQRLSSTEADIYRTALPISWINVDDASRVYSEAAAVLYPGDPEPLIALGRDMARSDLNGIYKVLLRVTTIPMVIQRTAKLWSNYHQRGEAHVERDSDEREADLVVSGYPDLPEAIRVNVCGYVQGVLDLTGSKNPKVRHDPTVPDAWRWHVTWD